ncbi:MAG TPA: Asp23/Gls24 family envelope stress response protein [Clostridiales bacterium]|nr:Asp23/Gls24 family envelope stress response protein [Clostridiales bacterium]
MNEVTVKVEKDNLQINTTENESNLTISEETLAIIVGLAINQVDGVAGMSTTITEELAEVFGKKAQSKGIKVEFGNDGLVIDLSIVIKFGYRIPDIAWNIQEKVRKDILAMTEYKVESINVYVQSIDFTE